MSIPTPFRRALVSAVAMSGALLLLAGCSVGSTDTLLAGPAGTGTDTGQEQAPVTTVDLESQGTVTVQLPDKSFTFIATMCMQHEGDMLVSGPGVDNESKEIAFFDLDFVNMDSSTYGGARIDLGTDQPMTSSDEFYAVDVGTLAEYSILYEGSSMTVEGAFRANGGVPIGPGTIIIACD